MVSDLTIISVSYNSASAFLSYWKKFLDTTQFKVVIVDNASCDDSVQILSRTFPGHHMLSLKSNIGYGRAANKGIEQCRSRFALLLNPDLKVSEELVIKLLALAMNDEDNTAIWAPAVAGAAFTGGQPVSVEAVLGAAMLFDLHRMNKVGFFDENIFLYSEETDLCYRTRQKGYEVKLCPGLYFEHIGDGSSAHHHSLVYMKSWHFGWSRCYYLHKHSLYSARYNPARMYRNYRFKSYIGLNSVNRLRYRGQADGIKAFIRGEKAFKADGNPQQSPV